MNSYYILYLGFYFRFVHFEWQPEIEIRLQYNLLQVRRNYHRNDMFVRSCDDEVSSCFSIEMSIETNRIPY